MSAFATLMADTGVPAMMDFFGDPATYFVADTAATVVVSAIVSLDVVVLNGQTGMQEYRNQIEIPSADLAGITPRRGDEITVGTARYIVLARDADDGYLSRFIVRRGDD